MGDGWDNHFSLIHYRPGNRLMLQACPAGARGGWGARVSLLSAAIFEAGCTYHVVAVLASDGALRLYIDGVLDAEADGLRSLPGGFTPADVGTHRAQNYCGRWMRRGQHV